jgi:hypothetical protein
VIAVRSLFGGDPRPTLNGWLAARILRLGSGRSLVASRPEFAPDFAPNGFRIRFRAARIPDSISPAPGFGFDFARARIPPGFGSAAERPRAAEFPPDFRQQESVGGRSGSRRPFVSFFIFLGQDTLSTRKTKKSG